MNWRYELGNFIRETDATFHRFFNSFKRGARDVDKALSNSLHDTASRVKQKAKDTKQKGGYR